MNRSRVAATSDSGQAKLHSRVSTPASANSAKRVNTSSGVPTKAYLLTNREKSWAYVVESASAAQRSATDRSSCTHPHMNRPGRTGALCSRREAIVESDEAYISGVYMCGNHPSPNRAAHRIASSDQPDTQIGGGGDAARLELRRDLAADAHSQVISPARRGREPDKRVRDRNVERHVLSNRRVSVSRRPQRSRLTGGIRSRLKRESDIEVHFRRPTAPSTSCKTVPWESSTARWRS